MPISAERRKLYGSTATWRAIRAAVQARAGDRCEGCGVANRSVRYSDEVENELGLKRATRIVCTTAHLDHDPTHNDGFELTGKVLPVEQSALRFYCQCCHNRHDAQHRAASRAKTLDRKRGQAHLFEEAGRG